jgi:hypothetical protein
MSNGYNLINYQTPVVNDINNFLNTDRHEASAHLRRIPHTDNADVIIKLIETLYYFNKTALNINLKSLGRNHVQYDITSIRTSSFRHIVNTYDYFENIINVDIVTVKGNINNCFEEYLPTEFNDGTGWVELNGLSIALKQSARHRIRLYYNSRDTIIIFTAAPILDYDNDYKFLKEFIAITPLLLPETWRNEHNELVALCRSVLDINATTWLELYTNYINNIDTYKNARTEAIRNLLLQLNNTRNNNLQQQLEEERRRIDSVKTELAQTLQRYYHTNALLIGGAETQLTEDDIKYIIDKNIIEGIYINGTTLYFSCTAPVLQYDKDAAEIYYKTIRDSDFKKLFKAVFIDEDYILHFTDCIKINYNTGGYSASAGALSHVHTVRGLPNPHHYHYNCWGNYNSIITELIINYDHLALFLQIKAAVGSLNMTDYTVLNRFKEDINNEYLWNDTVCVLWKSDKQMHSIKETLDKLKENTNETN